jgi:Kef-type K+ transport system membrane component KefB
VTQRTTLILLVGAFAGLLGGWLTVQAGQPWAAGVLVGAGCAVTAVRIAAEVIRE